MKLVLKRWEFTDKSTVGSLSIDGVFECFTIEDVVRATGIKVPGKTAIPYGVYQVEITDSPKFGREMPLIFNVLMPDGRKLVVSSDGLVRFEGVRAHWGNTADDSEGCVIVGRTYSAKFPDFVGESRAAFAELFEKLKAARDRRERITLSIEKGP